MTFIGIDWAKRIQDGVREVCKVNHAHLPSETCVWEPHTIGSLHKYLSGMSDAELSEALYVGITEPPATQHMVEIPAGSGRFYNTSLETVTDDVDLVRLAAQRYGDGSPRQGSLLLLAERLESRASLFTKDDVTQLRTLVRLYESGDAGWHWDEEIAWANSLADRIERQLPK